MDSELWNSGEAFLLLNAPMLTGLLAFCLIGLAVWEKPPVILRAASGIAGGAVLLAAAWIWLFRPVLLGGMA